MPSTIRLIENLPVICSIHAALTAAGVLAVLPGSKAIAVKLQAARLFAIAFLWRPAHNEICDNLFL